MADEEAKWSEAKDLLKDIALKVLREMFDFPDLSDESWKKIDEILEVKATEIGLEAVSWTVRSAANVGLAVAARVELKIKQQQAPNN